MTQQASSGGIYNIGFATVVATVSALLADSVNPLGKIAQVGVQLLTTFGFITGGMLFMASRHHPLERINGIVRTVQVGCFLVGITLVIVTVWSIDPVSKVGASLLAGWHFVLFGSLVERYRAPREHPSLNGHR